MDNVKFPDFITQDILDSINKNPEILEIMLEPDNEEVVIIANDQNISSDAKVLKFVLSNVEIHVNDSPKPNLKLKDIAKTYDDKLKKHKSFSLKSSKHKINNLSCYVNMLGNEIDNLKEELKREKELRKSIKEKNKKAPNKFLNWFLNGS